MNLLSKINYTEFVDLKFFFNFYSRHFSVGRVLIIASPSEKEVQSWRLWRYWKHVITSMSCRVLFWHMVQFLESSDALGTLKTWSWSSLVILYTLLNFFFLSFFATRANSIIRQDCLIRKHSVWALNYRLSFSLTSTSSFFLCLLATGEKPIPRALDKFCFKFFCRWALPKMTRCVFFRCFIYLFFFQSCWWIFVPVKIENIERAFCWLEKVDQRSLLPSGPLLLWRKARRLSRLLIRQRNGRV